METFDKLLVIKTELEKQVRIITKLIAAKEEVVTAITDIKFLKRHSGNKMLTGTSGKIGEEDILLRKVKLSTVSGCVSIPDLFLSLAETKLGNIGIKAEEIVEKNEQPWTCSKCGLDAHNCKCRGYK